MFTPSHLLLYSAYACSLLAWGFITYRFQNTKRILAFESRERTPWGPLGLFVCIFLALVTVASAFQETKEPGFSVSGLASFSAIYLVIVVVSQTWIRNWYGVSYTTLGWPKDIPKALADVRTGIILTIAAIGPVYALLALFALLDEPNKHPFVEMMQENPSPAMIGNILIAAIIVAPLFEEILFRQLAQGWLEKIETEWVTHRTFRNIVDHVEHTVVLDSQELRDKIPKSLMLRYRGWIPIFISSLLFSAVHIGQGSAPIPLFLFAVMLGYVYHKTHRILPCIIAHMFFNLFAMLSLYVQLSSK